ncbi:MAG: hypothetical protein HY788_23100 [Deltaproteobacteria bacterium]|nr:hypothetical protein [Deltaproteobacteria bacterium]
MSRAKVILGLVVSILLISSMTYAQLLGLPDDAPANRIIVPFFDVEENGTNDFLVVLVNVIDRDVRTHIVVTDRDTEHVYNFALTLTGGDVEGFSMRELISKMPSAAPGLLRVEEDGESFFRGEVFVDAQVPTVPAGQRDEFEERQGNVLLCYVYYIDLPKGALAGMNGLHVQYGEVDEIFEYTDPDTMEVVNNLVDEDGYERFTAAAQDDIEELIRYGVVDTGDSASLDFYVRYYIADSEGSDATLAVWTETADSNYSVSFLVWDEDENVISSGTPLPHQVNIIRLSQVVPSGFVSGGGGGWITVRSGNENTMMWVRERMVRPDGEAMDALRRVPRELFQ